jgi:hypothetical protein
MYFLHFFVRPGALKVGRLNILKSVGGGDPSVAGARGLSGAGEVPPPTLTMIAEGIEETLTEATSTGTSSTEETASEATMTCKVNISAFSNCYHVLYLEATNTCIYTFKKSVLT